MEYDTILYEVDDRTATITLNRPDQLNALSPAMVAELRHAYAAAEADDAVWTVLVTGSEDESEQPEHRRGSFGRPAPGFEADVREGELWFRGPFLMEGYYGRERHEMFDPDGWFRTGDLVDRRRRTASSTSRAGAAT